MEKKELTSDQLKSIIGGKSTGDPSQIIKAKGDIGQCIFSLFRNCG